MWWLVLKTDSTRCIFLYVMDISLERERENKSTVSGLAGLKSELLFDFLERER